jgi:hypothetical protein
MLATKNAVGALAVLLLACAPPVPVERTPDRSSPKSASTEAQESSLPWGWKTPIMQDDTDAVVDRKLGSATSTIAGHSISQIVTNATVRVRGDNAACAKCHTWAAASDRESFCARVEGFLGMPTAKGDGHDAVGAKPAVLKTLLKEWQDADCPE